MQLGQVQEQGFLPGAQPTEVQQERFLATFALLDQLVDGGFDNVRD